VFNLGYIISRSILMMISCAIIVMGANMLYNSQTQPSASISYAFHPTSPTCLVTLAFERPAADEHRCSRSSVGVSWKL
jgi:hypothetical protein